MKVKGIKEDKNNSILSKKSKKNSKLNEFNDWNEKERPIVKFEVDSITQMDSDADDVDETEEPIKKKRNTVLNVNNSFLNV